MYDGKLIWTIIFNVLLTDGRSGALFAVRNFARDSHNRKSLKTANRIWASTWPEFRFFSCRVDTYGTRHFEK